MSSLVTKLTLACLAMLAAVACSSTPTAPEPVTPPAEPAANPAPAAATANAADATNEQAAAASHVNAKLLGQGFKPVKVKNEFVYCRMEPMTGTQFKKRVCLTEAAIHDLEQQTKEVQESMTKQRTGPACFTKTC
jgi:hypothetical protein